MGAWPGLGRLGQTLGHAPIILPCRSVVLGVASRMWQQEGRLICRRRCWLLPKCGGLLYQCHSMCGTSARRI